MLDAHWLSRLQRPLARDSGRRRSLYLRTRDGVDLAVDVHVPSRLESGARVPTILRQTRYFRSVELPRALDFRVSRDAFDIVAPTRERFLARGYAWVDVDVRGSGVSSGSWPLPWSPDEVKDGAEVVDFIVAQPWSNGRVGSTGISYEGTTAEMLLVNHHPAVRAIAPRFCLFDAFEDVAFPGGVQLAWFTEGWSRFNRLLDAHRFHDAMAELVYVIARARAEEPGAPWAPLLDAGLRRLGPERSKALIGGAFGLVFRGGRRVDEDGDGRLRARALGDHVANGDVHELCGEGQFRDDRAKNRPDLGFDVVSPRGHIDALASSGAAIFSYGGWLDGAYGNAAARRFKSLEQRGVASRLMLGPWGHAGVLAHEPFGVTLPTRFNHEAELLRFFDLHLSGVDDGIGSEPAVRYFTLGEQRWKASASWPPPHRLVSLHLDRDRLSPEAPQNPAPRTLTLDPSFGTGQRTRWRGVLAAFVPADYPDLAERTRNAEGFNSAPITERWVISGHPLLRVVVKIAPDAGDFALMAYLIEARDDGTLGYVTEGQLRAVHSQSRGEVLPGLGPSRSFTRGDAGIVRDEEGRVELSFALLPTSYALRTGSRLRLVLTMGDVDHFAPIARAASTIELVQGRLDLPLEL